MGDKCNVLILSLLAIKLYRFFLAFFVRFWKQMQCIVSQPLPFLVLQNAYLVAKIQIYIGLEQTIILKKIIPQFFFDNFNRTTSCITVNELQTMGIFIVKVPLQTIHEPEVIWNDNSDKQDERLR